MEKQQSIFNIAGKYGSYNIVDNDVVFEYPDEVSISKEDLWKEIDADWEVWKTQEYARNRKAEYPPIEDQQDMQFHDAIDGTTTWQDTIQAVKNKYPKSE